MPNKRNNIQKTMILIYCIHNNSRRNSSSICIHNKTLIKGSIITITQNNYDRITTATHINRLNTKRRLV